MKEDTLAESIHNALTLLKTHGVEIRVPTVEQTEAMRVDQIQAIISWFEDPKGHPKPREIAPTVRLVKGAE